MTEFVFLDEPSPKQSSVKYLYKIICNQNKFKPRSKIAFPVLRFQISHWHWSMVYLSDYVKYTNTVFSKVRQPFKISTRF